MYKQTLQLLALALFLLLTGCSGEENSEEPPVIPEGVTDPAQLTALAEQKQRIGAFPEAIEILNQALKIEPQFLPAHYRMGRVLEEWGHKEESVQAYRRALEIDPNHIESRLGLASTYAKQFKNELAIIEYQKAARLKPEDTEILFKIALEYWYLQKLPETVEYYRKVIAINPDHLQAHLNLTSVYERLKQWEPALKEIAIARHLGKQTGNQQAIAIADNKLLFLKGRVNLSESDWTRKTSPPFE